MSREQDRELLEAAARAAGYHYRPNSSAIVKDGIPGNWNPLHSDADAFRLMVDMKTSMSFRLGMVLAICDGHHMPECTYPDKHAATRRAIVRAAAAMSEGREG